eukprot:SAG31_NODE_1584_length_7827_cov_2.129788_9_plen_75_part_00
MALYRSRGWGILESQQWVHLVAIRGQHERTRWDRDQPDPGEGCYFLVFVPTIREIRDFYREMYALIEKVSPCIA